MKKFILLSALLVCIWTGSRAITVEVVGSGTGSNYYLPIYSSYAYSYTQQIYPQSLIDVPGTISKFRFYYISGGSPFTNISNWTVYFGHTGKTYFASGSDWIPVSALTEVFSGNVTISSQYSWVEITLTTPFVYNNTDNLVIAVDENSAGYSTTAYWGQIISAANSGMYCRSSSNINPASPLSGSRSSTGQIPMLQLDIQPPGPFLYMQPRSLSFGYVPYGSISSEKSFTMLGGNLTDGPIVVTAPAGFEVSLTSGGPYSSSLSINYTPPDLTATIVYARFKPDAFNIIYNVQISATGGGATKALTVSGTSSLYPLYCASVTSYSSGVEIFNCTIGDLNNSSDCSTLAPGAGSVQNKYSNYYFDVPPPDLQKLTFVDFSVVVGTCNDNQFERTAIYIDFNQDGDFTDANESVYQSPQTNYTPYTETGSFYIPGDALLGYTMMRVKSIYTGSTSFINPCGTYYYGETEDYMVNILPAPSCPQPINLTVDPYDDISANLSWTPTGSENEWLYSYGEAPYPIPGNHGTKTQSSTITPVSGLSPSTTYQFYVRADCGSGDLSQWSGPASFTTRCASITAFPFSEGFEGTAFPPECWLDLNSGWIGGKNAYHAHSGDGYAFCSTLNAVLNSPLFTLASDCQLKFYYQTSYTLTSLDVLVGNTVIFQISNETNSGYQAVVVSLAQFTGQKISISFKNLSSWPIYIDDITLEEIPACNYPINPYTISTTQTTANLDWTPLGTETSWDIIYGTPGFDPSTEGTLVTGINTHPVILDPPFPPNSGFEWRVRAACGSGSVSEWSDPTMLVTDCAPVTSFPLLEDFDSIGFPRCWSTFKTSGPSEGRWEGTSYGHTPYCSPFSGDYMVYYHSDNYNRGTTGSICTPVMNLPGDDYWVGFWMYRDNQNTSYEHIDIYYNTAQSLTSATLLGTIHRYWAYDPPVTNPGAWYYYSFPLPAGSGGDNRYILWDGYSYDKANMFLDNIAVFQPGNLEGYVYDTYNNPVSEATITDPLGRTFTSDADGHYVISQTASGTLPYTCGKTGYCSQTYTVTIAAGTTTYKDFILPPEMAVTISPDQTVYYGYAPLACTTVSVNVTGGTQPYSYAWSNGETTASFEVCPQETTDYSVVVTDAYGCVSATASMRVCVIDVRCGNNLDKVLVCHIIPGNPEDPNALCIDAGYVAEHLAHGDLLGECGIEHGCGNQPSSPISAGSLPGNEESLLLQAFPNPTNGLTKFNFRVDNPGRTTIMLTNFLGQTVSILFDGYVPNVETQYLEALLDNVKPGLYLCILRTDSGKAKTQKLVIQR